MSRGHNFTRCSTCGHEYVCGDCITSDCELGREKLKCERYQKHLREQKSSAVRMLEIANDATKSNQQRAMAMLLCGSAWDDVCSALTNKELADALKNKVWANLKLGTEEIALMEQAIDRLEGKIKSA